MADTNLRKVLNAAFEKGSGIANYSSVSLDGSGNITAPTAAATFPLIAKSDPSLKVDYTSVEDEYKRVFHRKGKTDGTLKLTIIQLDAGARQLNYSTLKDKYIHLLKEENRDQIGAKNFYRFYPCLLPDESMNEKRPGTEVELNYYIIPSPNAFSANLSLFSAGMAATSLTTISVAEGDYFVDVEL